LIFLLFVCIFSCFQHKRIIDFLLEMKMRSNLATIGERWKQEAMALGKAEGKELGKAEGKGEGRTEGKAEALICLLVERFGALAPSLRTRIERARLETLNRWFKRAIAAPNVRSVFDSSR
jgi:flagellar biosynthesis/type III secretory pathway protein FliH